MIILALTSKIHTFLKEKQVDSEVNFLHVFCS